MNNYDRLRNALLFMVAIMIWQAFQVGVLRLEVNALGRNAAATDRAVWELRQGGPDVMHR